MNDQRLYLLGSALAAAMIFIAFWQVSKSSDSAFDQSPFAVVSQRGQDTVTINIDEGENAELIARKLEDAGIIRSALQFRVLVALEGVENQLGAGEYKLQSGMPTSQVVDILRRGHSKPGVTVTIREGLRAEEIADLLVQSGLTSKEDFLIAVAKDYRGDYSFLKDLPHGATLEGYLFPDTYNFARDLTPEEIVRQILDNFGRRFVPALSNGSSQTPANIHEVVILASIIEREAVVPVERPVMAGVFLHRLSLGMPLDADPTVQYAVANTYPESVTQYGYWKRELTIEDLRIPSPYNTRLYPGLPPGPISNPGIASLSAALLPANTTYLYFVAKEDGSHAFAETLQEHVANIRLYQGD